MNDDAELARLDAVIAENNAVDTPQARWKVADALFEKAFIVEERAGPEAAALLYEEAARRSDGATDDGPRGLLICALFNLRRIHDEADRVPESRAIAERIVAEHFDHPPEGTVEVIVNNALHLSRMLRAAGEEDRALALMERIVDRFGRREVPGHVLYRCMANSGIAGLLALRGKVDEGIMLYETVLTEIQGCTGSEADIVLAEALKSQAFFLYDSKRFAEGDARCLELIKRFSRSKDPELAQEARYAREMREAFGPSRGRTFGLRRRSTR